MWKQTVMLHLDAETWETAKAALHHLKQGFIYINFTLAMLIFVPYVTLILLDLVVYIGRLVCEWLSELLLLSRGPPLEPPSPPHRLLRFALHPILCLTTFPS